MTLKKYKKNLDSAIEEIKKLPLHQLDSNTELLKEAFEILYEHKIFALYRVELSKHHSYKALLFSTLTQYSGSLAFLAIQILAGNTIMAKRDFKDKERFFKKRCGIAINHLRAPVTYVFGTKCEGGFLLNGRFTWASGYGIFDCLVIGFHHNEKEYEAVVKFRDTKHFKVGRVVETFVGKSMATVNVELEEFFVKEKHIISSQPLGTYTQSRSVSKTIHFAFYGLGLGAIRSIEDEEVKRSLTNELEMIKEAFMKEKEANEMERLRVELFFLVQKIITTAMVLDGGKSILIEEKLQRYYRELIMFNANGLNGTIKEYFKDFVLN